MGMAGKNGRKGIFRNLADPFFIPHRLFDVRSKRTTRHRSGGR